jgi:hypothetical protein
MPARGRTAQGAATLRPQLLDDCGPLLPASSRPHARANLNPLPRTEVERNTLTTILVGCVGIGAVACGSRTALEVEMTAARADDGATPTSDTTSSGSGPVGVICAFHAGPVASCDAGPGAGPIQGCDSVFPRCVNVDGNWGCCVGAGPYNGPGGSCRFTNGVLGRSYDCP